MLLVEPKTVKASDGVHMIQFINHPQASRLRFCLLLSFGKPLPEIRRVVNDL